MVKVSVFRRSDSVSLFSRRPELRHAWSKQNDSSIDPESLSAGLAKEFFWDCLVGHTFSSSPAKLSSGRGCQYCSGKKVLDGFNDLACLDADKAKFFNESKNGFTAHEIVAGSTKRVWWFCPDGHEWEQDLRGFKAKSGCPVCRNRVSVEGTNDLKATHPEIASQLSSEYTSDILKTLLPNSTKKLNWVCGNSHVWKASVRDRVSGTGCPYCTNKWIWKGYNDFATVHPELVAEWDELQNTKGPDEVTAGSSYSAHWRCSLGHSWQTQVLRRSAGRGCVYCANREVWTGYNDLETRFPEIASEWDPKKNHLLPNQVLFGTNAKHHWICPDGHSYESQVSKRTGEGTGCPICRGLVVISGVNDLESQRPILASRWSSSNDQRPNEVFYNSRIEKFTFVCPQNHEYRSTPGSAKDEYCPTCSNKSFEPGFNDLQTVRPDLSEEFVSMGEVSDPNLIAGWTREVANWKCKIGHEWSVAVRDRVQGNNCPYCSNKRVQQGFNDLESQRPEISSQWDYAKNGQVKPSEVITASPKKYWWLCPFQHSYEQSLFNRVNRGADCVICSNRTLLKGFNDLKSRFPELAAEWHPKKNPRKADDVIFGSSKNAWWLCELNHEWQASPSTRIKGIGCQSCNKGGFNPAAPSFVYFIRNPQLRARKVGIRNATSSRLKNFSILGWELVHEEYFEDGVRARIVEKQFFIWLRRELGYPQFLTNEEMEPYAGASETFSGEVLDDKFFLNKLHQLIDEAD